MPSTDLRQLAKQERQTRASLENIEEFLSAYQDERDRGSVELRLKRLDEIFEKFCDVRLKIEILTDDHVAEELLGEATHDERHSSQGLEQTETENARLYKEFENNYFRLKRALIEKCASCIGTVSVQHATAARSTQQSRTKYPELTLPTFSGKLSEWINFRDNFKSLIHDNNQLNTMDKFNYLRASLKDEALFQINQIQVIAANYSIAWSILEAKYENHKLIAQEHLRALFNASALKCENFHGLNTLLTTFKIHLQQLEKLGETTENWSTLLAFMLSQKLDDDTLRHWETHYSSKNIPSYSAMIHFLDNHCAILQSTSTHKSIEGRKQFRSSVIHTTVSSSGSCVICNVGSHTVEQCRRFGKMRIVDRRVMVRKHGLCFNCLVHGHFATECTRASCSDCGQRHHYLLHSHTADCETNGQNYHVRRQWSPQTSQVANSQLQQSNVQTQSRMTNTQPNSQHTPVSNGISSQMRLSSPTNTPTTIHHTATLYNTQQNPNTTILSTAIIRLSDYNGNTILARALLDNGSQLCLISENISRKLAFKRCRENLPVKGVGGSLKIAKHSVVARVHSQVSSFATAKIKFFVLSRITLNLPQVGFNINSWSLPSEVRLADPWFNQPNTVDVILGVSIFYELLLNEQIKLAQHGPILRNTHLGWIVAGELSKVPANSYSAVVATVSTVESHEELVRFQELESCRTKCCSSLEESTSESIFEETGSRDQDRKFRVELPEREFISDKLEKSKEIATKRFNTMERRFNVNIPMKGLGADDTVQTVIKGANLYILEGNPDDLRDNGKLLDFDTLNSAFKPLSLFWESAAYRFWNKSLCWPSQTQVTHRLALTDTARSMEPCGLVGPVIVTAKLFVQMLWKRRYSLKEPSSDEPTAQFPTFRKIAADVISWYATLKQSIESTIWSNLVRLLALLWSIAHNCKMKNCEERKRVIYTIAYHDEAVLALTIVSKYGNLTSATSDIAAEGELCSTFKFYTLNAVPIDELLCVGGRLRNVPISHGREHQTILV